MRSPKADKGRPDLMRRILIFVSTLFVASIAGVALYAWLQKPKPPLFRSRALVPVSLVTHYIKHDGIVPDDVLKRHQEVAEKVLMIRDPTVVDSPDFDSDPPYAAATTPEWGFASIIRKAFERAGAPSGQVQTFVDTWRMTLDDKVREYFEAAWKLHDPNFSLERAPVRLLAIANRIDLGDLLPIGCEKGTTEPCSVCKSEVHFVFAAVPASNQPDDYLRLIVEFTLPCLSKREFKELAGGWASLQGLDWNGAASPYHVRLKRILSYITARAQSARLRLNENSFSGTWSIFQLSFKQDGLKPALLDQEPPRGMAECHNAIDDLGKFVKAGNLDLIAASRYTLPDSLILPTDSINLVRHVLTLAPDVAPADHLDAVRFALSLNSCAGCHGVETRTKFHHLGMRLRWSRSCLSPFLTGVGDACGDNVSTGHVTIGPLSPANGCDVKLEKREFNDLLRRHLFLHRVQKLDATSSDREWREALDNSGLTAPQSH